MSVSVSIPNFPFHYSFVCLSSQGLFCLTVSLYIWLSVVFPSICQSVSPSIGLQPSPDSFLHPLAYLSVHQSACLSTSPPTRLCTRSFVSLLVCQSFYLYLNPYVYLSLYSCPLPCTCLTTRFTGLPTRLSVSLPFLPFLLFFLSAVCPFCLSLYPSVCQPTQLYISVHVSLTVFLHVCLSFYCSCLYLYSTLYPSLYPFCLSFFPVSVLNFLSLYPSVCLATRLFNCLSICLSISLPFCLPFQMSACLAIRLYLSFSLS